MEISQLKNIALNVRKDILHMLCLAGSGHPGGSLSAVELLTDLYFNHLDFEPSKPNRDYFILSKGHVCPVLYAILSQKGYIPKEELDTLRKLGSRLQGHPALEKSIPGIEISTGSLGYGLSIGVGVATAFKASKKNNRVYVLMGDGEQQEGSVWEAVMSAAHFKLDNLCAVVDCNGLQIDGKVEDVLNVGSVADKYKSFGWNVIEIDGHSMEEVDSAYTKAKQVKNMPTVIVAKTVKGKGVSFMENVADWHGKAPSQEQYEQAIKELESK